AFFLLAVDQAASARAWATFAERVALLGVMAALLGAVALGWALWARLWAGARLPAWSRTLATAAPAVAGISLAAGQTHLGARVGVGAPLACGALLCALS